LASAWRQKLDDGHPEVRDEAGLLCVLFWTPGLMCCHGHDYRFSQSIYYLQAGVTASPVASSTCLLNPGDIIRETVRARQAPCRALLPPTHSTRCVRLRYRQS